MPKKLSKNQTDNLIREALRLEINSVDPPPADQVWNRIESGLGQQPKETQRFRYGWTRYATIAAAACLILFLGGIGIFRMANYVSPTADPDRMFISDLENDSVAKAADDQTIGVLDVNEERADCLEEIFVSQTADNLTTVDWPESLPGGFTLEAFLKMSPEPSPVYHGAFYGDNNTELLLIEVEQTDEDLFEFITRVGSQIEFIPLFYEETNGYLYFYVDDRPGLARETDSGYRFVLVLSGNADLEDLEIIITSLD